MTEALSSNTKAILLLTAPLISGRGRKTSGLLSPGEYKKLARRLRELGGQPADLLAPGADELLGECARVIDRARLERLLARGFLLSQAVEHWQARAIWVVRRNKSIYALADAALVVSAEEGKGGTWAGATEQLAKLRLVPIYVRSTGTASSGLDALREKGARPWPNPEDAEGLDAALAAPGAEPASRPGRGQHSVRSDSQIGLFSAEGWSGPPASAKPGGSEE